MRKIKTIYNLIDGGNRKYVRKIKIFLQLKSRGHDKFSFPFLFCKHLLLFFFTIQQHVHKMKLTKVYILPLAIIEKTLTFIH